MDDATAAAGSAAAAVVALGRALGCGGEGDAAIAPVVAPAVVVVGVVEVEVVVGTLRVAWMGRVGGMALCEMAVIDMVGVGMVCVMGEMEQGGTVCEMALGGTVGVTTAGIRVMHDRGHTTTTGDVRVGDCVRSC